MAQVNCDEIIAKVEGKKAGAEPNVNMPADAGEVQSKTEEAKKQEEKDAQAVKGDQKPKVTPPAAPVKAPAIKKAAPTGAQPAVKAADKTKKAKAPKKGKKLPSAKGGGAKTGVSKTSPLATAIANAEGDVGAFLDKYEPKSPEPMNRAKKIDELVGLSKGFKGKLVEQKAAGSFLSKTMDKVKGVFDVTKDWKGMTKAFENNPYKRGDDKLSKIGNVVYTIREITRMVGGIAGKVGLACTILSLLTCWIPPLGAALQLIGRILNVIGIVCDVINLVSNAILIAVNAMKLKDPNINPEEKAAIADLMLKDATDAGGSVMSLAMTFGGKFLGGFKSAKNGILGPLQKWVGAAFKRVTTVIGGKVKAFAMKIVHALGLGVNKLKGPPGAFGKFMGKVGEVGGKAFDKTKGFVQKWGEKYAESTAMSNRWANRSGFAKVEAAISGDWAKKAGENLSNKMGNAFGETKFGRNLQTRLNAFEQRTLAIEKKFAVDAAGAQHQAQLKYNRKAETKAKAEAREAKTEHGEGSAEALEAQKKYEQAAVELHNLQKKNVSQVRDEARKKFNAENKGVMDDGQFKVVRQSEADKKKLQDHEKGMVTSQKEGHEAKLKADQERQKTLEQRRDTPANREEMAKVQADAVKRQEELAKIADAEQAIKEQNRILRHERAKANPDPNVIQNAEVAKANAERSVRLSTTDAETHWKQELKDAEARLKVNPRDADALAAKEVANGYLEPLAETRRKLGPEMMKDKLSGIWESINAKHDKKAGKDQRKDDILRKYGIPSAADMEEAKKAQARQEHSRNLRSAMKETQITPTTAADVDAALAGLGGEQKDDHEDDGGPGDDNEVKTAGVGDDGGNPDTAPQKTPEPAKKDEGGGDDAGALPFWPALSKVHEKEMKDLAEAKNVLVDFKKAQIDAGQKAQAYAQQIGAMGEKRQTAGEEAKKNQALGNSAAKDQNAGIPGADNMNKEAGKGDEEKNRGKSTASEKVTADIPPPKKEGWFSRILNSIKNWFVNTAKKVMTTVQNAIADGILRLIAGVSMKELQDYATCQRGMKQRGAQAGQKADQTSGTAAGKDSETTAKTADEKTKAMGVVQEAQQNVQEADQLLGALDEQVAGVNAEVAATKAFVDSIVAAKKEEEAKKKAEEAKKAADDKKAADEAKAAKGKKKGKGKGKKGKTETKEAKPEVNAVDKAKIKAAAAIILSHADTYAGQLGQSVGEQKATLTQLASKRKGVGHHITEVTGEATGIVDAYKAHAAESKQKAQKAQGQDLQSAAQVTQLAAELRKSAGEVDSAAAETAKQLNAAFRKVYDVIAEAPEPFLSSAVGAGMNGYGAYSLVKSGVDIFTPGK